MTTRSAARRGAGLTRAGLVLLILLVAAPLRAQDWRYDEAFDATYNCKLITELVAEYGGEPLYRHEDGHISEFRAFVAAQFPECQSDGGRSRAGRRKAKAEADDGIVAVLRDHQVFTLFEPGCSVNLSAGFEGGLAVVKAGDRLDELSVEVFLPGESAAIAMPHSDEDETTVYGVKMPLRRMWAEGDSIPLGDYALHLRIFDESYRFRWQREDDAVNMIVVNCLDLAPEGEFGVEFTASIEDGEVYHFDEVGCLIGTFVLTEDMLTVLIGGERSPSTTVEVIYPRMRERVEFDRVMNMTHEGVPYRTEGVFADTFPTGAYHIRVTMDERVWHIRWDRANDDYRTIIFNCPIAENEDA